MGSSDDCREVKLSLLSKSLKFDRLPGQDPARTYGVLWDSCPQPGSGWGYLVEFVGRRRARVLAWLNQGGDVYACDGPMNSLAEGRRAVRVAHYRDDERAGRVELCLADGSLRPVSRYRETFLHAFELVDPLCDLGPYMGARLDYRRFSALCYLAFCVVNDMAGGGRAGAAPHTATACGFPAPDEVLAAMMGQPLPDALDVLLWRAENPELAESVSPFERYAARVLTEAGAERVRPIAAGHRVELVRLSTTEMFWIRFNAAELEGHEEATLLHVESALNRLSLVARRARVEGSAAMGEDAYAAMDESALCAVAAIPKEVSAHDNNPLCAVRGVRAVRGGEWDVRTRLAQAWERLVLPFRLVYRYDCDASRGLVAVDMVLPAPSSFPASQRGGDCDGPARRASSASAYALRVAAAVVSAAFGSCTGVVRVLVTGYFDDFAGETAFSLSFDRVPFVMTTLPKIQDGTVAERGLNDDPARLLLLLAPQERSVAFGPDGGFSAVCALPTGLDANRPQPWLDARELPEDLKGLLRADRVCELEVMHDEGEVTHERIEQIVADVADAPLFAMTQFEEVVAACSCDEEDGKVPLYCASALGRFLVSLADGDEGTRYRKIADAAFDARHHLSGLYHDIGDEERSLAVLSECAALAPTNPQAYVAASVACARNEMHREAAAYLKHALRVTLNTSEATYAYYRLAFSLWRIGQGELGAACYVLALGDDRMGEQARSELDELMEEIGMSRAPDRAAAEASLKAADIAVAPSDAVYDIAARSAVGLVDAGIFELAAPLVSLLSNVLRDDALTALGTSLRYGVHRS